MDPEGRIIATDHTNGRILVMFFFLFFSFLFFFSFFFLLSFFLFFLSVLKENAELFQSQEGFLSRKIVGRKKERKKNEKRK